jgi:hypothetical protein
MKRSSSFLLVAFAAPFVLVSACTKSGGGPGAQGGGGSASGGGGPGGMSSMSTGVEQPLVRERPEPPGSNCGYGGVAISTGLDKNGDGTLENDEVSATVYVCNGAPGDAGMTGDAGMNGGNALVRVDPEPAGPNCVNGGLAVKTGIDTNNDGVLEDSEVTSTSYACNGPGEVTLVRLDPEPPGPNCSEGGTAIKSGLDQNHDGTLEDNEVTATSYACNAPPVGGGVLEGSFTIHNSLDVDFLSAFTGVSGDVYVDAPGLTTISLPGLTSIGGVLGVIGAGAPDLAALYMPSLASVGTIQLEAPLLATLSWPSLTSVGAILMGYAVNSDTHCPSVSASLELPALASVGTMNIWCEPGEVTPSVHAPALQLAQSIDLVARPTNPPPSIDLRSLTTAGSVQVNDVSAYTAIDLSSLQGVTSYLFFGNDGSPAVLELPALTSVGIELDLWVPGADVHAPRLASVAAFRSDGFASFDAPLANVDGDFEFFDSSNAVISFPDLVSIGGNLAFGTVNMACNCNNTGGTNSALVTLDFPALASVGSHNEGSVVLCSNPLLPQCRANALVAQLTQAGWTGTASHACQLASGPCP